MKLLFRFLAVSLLLVTANAGQTLYIYGQPTQDYIFYGSVTIDGDPAPDGTTVSTNIGGSTSTSGGQYTLQFPSSAGTPGSTITFQVNGISAGSASLPQYGIPVQRDLSVTSPVPIFTLTVQRTGNGNISPSLGNHTYNENTVVNISASPSSGWAFDSWSGEVADPNSSSTSVTMDGDKTVTAIFTELEPVPTFTLTIQQTGQGSVSPSVGDHSIEEDDSVTVTATPADGWRFESWTGDVNNPNSASTSVTMDEDKTITANFIELIDDTPPVITNVQVNNITRTSATITWTTNEISTSVINYSPGSLTFSDNTLVSSHSVTLTGLTPATQYTFSVSSADKAGNTSTSTGYNFKTDGLDATFVTSDWRFEITDTTEGGKNVKVEFVVSNIGDIAGSYSNILKINDNTVDTFEGNFDPSSSRVVTLNAVQTGEGSYIASIEDFRISFNIVAPPLDDGTAGISPVTIGIVVGAVLLLMIIVGFILSRTYYLFMLVRKDQ